MNGGMDQVGPFANPVVAVLVIILPALLGLALYRGEQAHRNRAEKVIRGRTRRAYLCILVWGTFVAFVGAVALTSAGWLEVVGILGAIPVGIVVIIGLFHALMVCRVRRIQMILLATCALVATGLLPTLWWAVVAVGYGVGVVGATVQGLHRLSGSVAS